jgi:Predicted acetyltransferase
MKIVDLNAEEVSDIESRLEAYDDSRMHFRMDGCIQIGIEEDGQLVAGLDACMTAFRILYVSTLFVNEEHRRKGFGTALIREMEARAAEMGATVIRLDTFDWQGKEFYEALGYETVGHYENRQEGYAEYFFLKRLKR